MEILGWSTDMGPKLRQFVTERLLADLRYYLGDAAALDRTDIRFDWSETCIEGHTTGWLDGTLHSLSGIQLFDAEQRLVAEGWMDFVETEDDVEVFWLFVRGGEAYGVRGKDDVNIPRHVWTGLSEDVRALWRKYAPPES